MIAETGFATTLEPEVKFNPVDGDHEYVDAPLAVKFVLVPEHVVELPLTEIVGDAFTKSATVFDALHAPEVPDIV